MRLGWLEAIRRAWRGASSRMGCGPRAEQRRSPRRIPEGSIVGRRFTIARRRGLALEEADIALGVGLHDRDERLRRGAAKPLSAPPGFDRIGRRIGVWRDSVRQFIDPRDGEWVKAIDQWPATLGSSAASRLLRAQAQADLLLQECEDIGICVAALPAVRHAFDELAARGQQMMPRYWRGLAGDAELEAGLLTVASLSELAAWRVLFHDCVGSFARQATLLRERCATLAEVGDALAVQAPQGGSLEASCDALQEALEAHSVDRRRAGRAVLDEASERHIKWLRSNSRGPRAIRMTSGRADDWVLKRWRYLHAVVERDQPR